MKMFKFYSKVPPVNSEVLDVVLLKNIENLDVCLQERGKIC